MPRRPASPSPRGRLPVAPLAAESFEQYLRDIRDLPMITDREEERECARLARAGDADAAERLVTARFA